MRLSFTTFACPEWSMDQILQAAQQFGYHGVEFRCDAGHLHGVEISALSGERQQVREAMDQINLQPCCLATSLQFAREEVIDQALPRIELAADIGCPALRVFCGPEPPGQSRAATIETVTVQLRRVAEMCEAAHIQLLVETHDTFSKGADAGACIRRTDHPLVGIVYDNMHPYRMGEDLETTIAAITGHVRHVHFHDALNAPDKVVIRRMGEGQMPVDEMFDAVVNMGFDGFLSGEWFYNQYGDTPEEALAAYYADMTELARRHGVYWR